MLNVSNNTCVYPMKNICIERKVRRIKKIQQTFFNIQKSWIYLRNVGQNRCMLNLLLKN